MVLGVYQDLLTVDVEMNVDLRSADPVPGLTDELAGHVPGDGGQLQPARVPPNCLQPLESSLSQPTPPDLGLWVSVCLALEPESGALWSVVVRVRRGLSDGGGLKDRQTVGHCQRGAGPLQLAGVVTFTLLVADNSRAF